MVGYAGEDFFADVAKGIFSLRWNDKSLGDKIRQGDELVRARVLAVLEYKAPQVEAHMKQNAPWTDQTGNARNGLRAEAFEDGTNMGIILYHQVPYGPWLELANSGRYAVILPTIDVMGPEVMAALAQVMETL